jgi:hypothetical protein
MALHSNVETVITVQSKEVSILVLPPPVLGPVPANETLPATSATTTTNAVNAFFIKLSPLKFEFAVVTALMKIRLKQAY